MPEKQREIRAIYIDAAERRVSEVGVIGLEDMQTLVGGYIATGYTFENGDTLFVDDEGLLKEPSHFFLIPGAAQPFAGDGLIVGAADTEGETMDATSTVEEIQEQIRFLDRESLMLLINRSHGDSALN